MIRRFAVLAMAISLVAGFAVLASPASAQYVPGQPGCIAEPQTIDADTATNAVLECIGCPPNVEANAFVLVDGEEVPIGSATVSDDPDGGVNIPVVFPALPEGDYTILVRCGPVLLSNVLTVIGTGGQVVTGQLPVTGSDYSLLIQIALMLIVIGGLLALTARKRRHAYD